MNERHPQRGFITLAAVLLLLAVSVAVALEALMIAWQSVDLGSSAMSAVRARSLADACAEMARSRFWADATYAGSESLPFDEGRCTVMPIAAGSYTTFTEGVSGDSVARVVTTFDVSVDEFGSVQAVRRIRFERVAEF